MTWCDPDDASAASAGSFAACASTPQNALGPTPAGETRATFDNVADYGGFSRTPIDDVAGGNAMTGYTASVAVTRAGATFGLSPTAALQVTVTVQRAGADNFALSGYRFLYAPRN